MQVLRFLAKRKVARNIVLLMSVSLLTACSNKVDYQATGSIAGFVAGGALGAIAAHPSNSSNQGVSVLVGMVVGTLVGSCIGFILDQRYDTDTSDKVLNQPDMNQAAFDEFINANAAAQPKSSQSSTEVKSTLQTTDSKLNKPNEPTTATSSTN